MTVIERLKKIFLYANADERMLERIEPEIAESNRRSLLVFSGVALFFLVIMSGVSFLVEAVQQIRFLYIIGAVLALVIQLLTRYRAKGNIRMISGLMHSFICILLSFGILLGTVSVRDEVTASYIALLLMLPQMFTDRPYRIVSLILVSIVVYVGMVFLNKVPSVWASDMINALVFGSISAIVCAYTMMIKVERFCLVEKVQLLAETDQLTGLQNRTSYELKRAEAQNWKQDGTFCVYVDVNGLHDLNDTKGHAAGDRMLQFVAEAVKDTFGAGDCYRIGGDEFVVLGNGRTMETVAELAACLCRKVEAGGYHVAVGIAGNADADTLVQQAEVNMYADKSRFYSQPGRERRRKHRTPQDNK